MKAEHYAELTVGEVKEALDSGALTADEVRSLEAESGKGRKTVRDLVGDEPESEPEQASGGPVRVEAGGIDPRLVEARERQREEERAVNVAHASAPATLDPKLAKIRENTIARERELAGRALTKPPVVTRRES